MKTRYVIITLLASIMMGGGMAFAQSNGVPGPDDYKAFSGFITDRNIFDSTREPHDFSDRPRPAAHHHTPHHYTPTFTFVGAMVYSKGTFAFFNANSDDLKNIAAPGQTIANGAYTVVDISLTRVKLQSADKKQLFDLKVGDGMRQEDGKWALATAEDTAGASSGSAIDATAHDADESNDSAPTKSTHSAAAAPSSTSPPNEILKRLMELRKQESQ